MRHLVLLAGLAAAAPAAARTGQGSAPAGQSSAQGDVAVTIYNNDLALVQDKRQLNLPARRSRQEFPDVSARIRPETVTLSGEGIEVVEQDFDLDLLSPEALMEKAVGQVITLVSTNPASGQEVRERATVLAVDEGVVLRIGDRIEVLRDDGLPVRVIFDKVPENLRARPTLSVTVESARAGARPVTLSYLTPGLGWKADYVTMFDEEAGRIDVQGWVTLTNTSGTTYANADTLLVARQVQQGRNGAAPAFLELELDTEGCGTVRSATRLGRRNGRALWAVAVPANGTAPLPYRIGDVKRPGSAAAGCFRPAPQR